MLFAFKPDESACHAVKRLAHNQLDDAIKALTNVGEGSVHTVRTRLKRFRALLRLARRMLPGSVRRCEDEAARDCARRFSSIREAEVRATTIAALPASRHGATAALRERFEADRAALSVHLQEVVPAALDALRSAQARVGTWRLSGGWSDIGEGLARTQREAASALAAVDVADAATLHEWRKRVKDLDYQSRLFLPAWPEQLAPWLGTLDRLGTLLGDDHDLHVLRQEMRTRRDIRLRDHQALLRDLDRRHRELQEEALALGRRVHAEDGDVLAARMLAWLKAWRGERRWS